MFHYKNWKMKNLTQILYIIWVYIIPSDKYHCFWFCFLIYSKIFEENMIVLIVLYLCKYSLQRLLHIKTTCQTNLREVFKNIKILVLVSDGIVYSSWNFMYNITFFLEELGKEFSYRYVGGKLYVLSHVWKSILFLHL